MKKYYLHIVCLMITCVFISSCNTDLYTESKLSYTPPSPEYKTNTKLADEIFINKIRDKRKKEQALPKTPDLDPLLLIPFYPYSHSKINPVRRYCFFQPNLTEILQKLFVTEIIQSNIFDNVYCQTRCSDKITPKYKKDMFILDIELKKAVWSRNLTYYGLSYPGTFLWAIGFPVSYGSVTLEVQFKLLAPDDNQVIAKDTFSKTISCTEWVYEQANYKPPIAELKLAEIFPKIARNLRTFLIKNIKEYNRSS